jgi:hypothetical protein
MTGTVATINNIKGRLKQDENQLALSLVALYSSWKLQRDTWEEEKKELRNYIFATDTSTTTNSNLPWKNKTTIPKICQIRDNLHANYMDALFPNDDWLVWEGDDESSTEKEKRQILEQYTKNKAMQSGLRETISQLLYDYIDYGNAFGEVIWVNETHVDPVTNEEVTTYMGPRAIRISPFDIIFNPTAVSFNKSVKFRRYVKSIGEVKKEMKTRTDLQFDAGVFQSLIDLRGYLSTFNREDLDKAEGYIADGFGTLSEYYGSGLVEFLEFEGDWYDATNDVLYENRIITIVDRMQIIRNIPNPNWLGRDNKTSVGWRDRPDNLYAMGPLDNLVGMQYRLDHLENFKADAMDQTIMPPLKKIGQVEPFTWAPGVIIDITEDGDLIPMPPNPAVFQVNNEIAYLMQTMEEMAGAPREAMGIRTPGEKTAFEVQSLQNAGGRIFNNKILKFSIQMLEPLVNLMVEAAKRNMNTGDVLRVTDSDLGVVQFMSITKDDLTAKGKLRPVGARHYAARAQLMQNLTGIFNSPIGQIIQPDLSRKALTSLIEETMGLQKWQLFSTNVAVTEQMETQRIMNESQQTLQNEQTTPVDENMINPQAGA